MLKSSLCDCNNAYILAKGTTVVISIAAAGAAANNANNKIIIKFALHLLYIDDTYRWCSIYLYSNSNV